MMSFMKEINSIVLYLSSQHINRDNRFRGCVPYSISLIWRVPAGHMSSKKFLAGSHEHEHGPLAKTGLLYRKIFVSV
jgi:hypothetical protein